MKKLRFTAAGVSDVGIVKTQNEDAYCYKIADAGDFCVGVFAVADGVGGLDDGTLASNIAIASINHWWDELVRQNAQPDYPPEQSLIEAAKYANRKIFKQAAEKNTKMGTTLSVLFLYGDEYTILHTGDSRIYKGGRQLKWKFEQLTQDQTAFVEREAGGQKILRQVLASCLGIKADASLLLYSGLLKKNETYLLCSDGVYKTIEEGQISQMLREGPADLKNLCTRLVETAKSNQERDNITALAVHISG